MKLKQHSQMTIGTVINIQFLKSLLLVLLENLNKNRGELF